MEKGMKQNYNPESSAGTDKINLALIASGSGTDADSIMAAWEAGWDYPVAQGIFQRSLGKLETGI